MDENIDRIITPNYKVLNDNFTEIVAYQLNYFEITEKTGMAVCAYDDLKNLEEEAFERYQRDAVFNARVKSMVAMLMRSVQEERDNRLDGLPFKRFRIVEP